METKKINDQEYVRLSDIYEWTLGKLSRNEFDLQTQEQTLLKLKELSYLKTLISKHELMFKRARLDPKLILVEMRDKIIRGILTNDIPSDYMSISYIHYMCKQRGIDVRELQQAIDENAETLIKNYFK